MRYSLSSDLVAPTVVVHGTMITGSRPTLFQNDIASRIKGFSKRYWKHAGLR